MTSSPKPNVFNPVRVLTSGLGFVFFAVVCLLISQGAFADNVQVTVNGMGDATNYADTDIIDNLGASAYNHTGTITGTSSLTVNATIESGKTRYNYRQCLKGADGSYPFTGSITVNGGQLLVYSSKLSTKTINLDGGDMYVMFADCLPHDAVVNVGSGSFLDVEGAANAIIGATINVSSGGTFRIDNQNHNDADNPINLNIAGTGGEAYTGAIHVRGGTGDLQLTSNIKLRDNAELFLTNMSTNRQLLIRGKLTGSSTMTFASDDANRWIRLYEGTGTGSLDMSEFAGNIVADKVKLRLYTNSLGTGSNITAQNSATAYFNNTTALNNYTGSFTAKSNGTIYLEAAGKLNNLSGDADGKVNNNGKALTLNNTADTEFPGVISGSGTIEKIGTGTLTLSGANSCTGKVTISAGKIVLTGNGKLGSGAVVNNSALEFNYDGESEQTIGSVISGTGTVTKKGSGTVTLTGASTCTGKTTVSGGTLKLSGSGAKLASTTIDVAAGATLLYDNTFPHNTSALTINVTNGTLEFYNTTVSTTHTNNGICSGVAGQDVTINGTGATFLIDGGGTVSAIDGTGKSTITFALDSNSVFHVKNGYFINGGYATQNWDNNKAELRIGATGKVECWDGAKMQFGGLSGDEGAQLVNIKAGKGMVIGNGVTANQSYTYNGSISLNGKNIDFVGAGTQTLNGAISNVSLTSKAGTLVLGTASNDINIGSSSVIKADGGAVRVDGNVVVDSALTVYGTWTGNGSINVKSGGELKADRSYTFAKGITLSGGLLVNDSANAATVNSPITVSSASQVKADGKDLKLTGGLYGSANLTTTSSASAKWVYLSGEGNFTGNLIVKGYVVTGVGGKGTETATASTTPYLGSGEIQLDGGLLLNNSSYWEVPNTINVVSNSSIRAGYSRPFTFSGNITGSGNLTVENDNNWVYMKTHSDNNTFKGDVQINYSKNDSQGRVRLDANQPFGANAGVGRIYGTLDMNGFSQQFKGLLSDGTKGNIYNNTNTQSTLTLDTTSKNNTYYGVINGNIALNIIGTGTQTFANNGSTFTGNVVIDGGTVKATAAHASYNTTALGKFSVTGGRTITINSGAELVLGTNDVVGGCTISNYNANSMRLIVKGGKLSGTNNNPLYNATFKNGAEIYGNNNRDVYQSFWLMGTNTVSFDGDGTTAESPVKFNGASGVIYVLEGTIMNVADITLSDDSDLVVNVILGDMSQNSVTNNSLTKTGSGTMELTAANTYKDGTTISEGVLKFTDNAVVANGPVTVGANGTLEYNLSSGKKQLLTIYETEDSNNKITSTGKVVKTGDGTLQICTSAAGQVDASSFVVSSGRLDMKEYFKGLLTVEAGATLSPGNSIGKLTVDGDFNLNGGTLLMEVAGPSVDDSDQLIVTNGNLIFGEGATIVLDFVNGMSPNAEFAVIIDAPNSNDSWVNYVDASYFTDLSYAQTGGRWVLSGHVDANAVPEPSTWALLALGVIVLFLRKRIRN